MKNSKFAALFMAASIILAGCEIDENAFADINFEQKEVREGELRIGTVNEEGRKIDEEKNVFKAGEPYALEIDNGSEPFNTSLIILRLNSKDDDGRENIIQVYDVDTDPIWYWMYFKLSSMEPGSYVFRAYNSDKLIGEAHFEIVEE